LNLKILGFFVMILSLIILFFEIIEASPLAVLHFSLFDNLLS